VLYQQLLWVICLSIPYPYNLVAMI